MPPRKKLEKDLESEFMKEMGERMPGCMLLKGNSAMRQGIPDRLFLHGPHWAALEFKKDSRSEHQPSQDWYVERLNDMSYAAIVTPDNYHEVIDEIQSAFGA